MNDERQTKSGTICDLGVLDLRYAATPEELESIHNIHDVGVILIYEAAAAALSRIHVHDVGSVVIVPSGSKVNCMTGQLKISGASMEAGDPETILMLVGQTIIQGKMESVGYKEVRVVGQLMAPRDSQAVLGPKLSQVTGQVVYVPENCRVIMGKETINQEFLELLQEPTPLVVMGHLTFESDVSKELVQQKIPEIVLLGAIHAPRAISTLLSVITKEKLGKIVAVD